MPQVTSEILLVVNRTKAPFALSDEARNRIEEVTGKDAYDLPRDDVQLILAVTALGSAASGPGCDLQVVNVPIIVDIEIDGDAEEISVHGGAYEVN